jgi:hypothetical protein
MSSLTCAFVLGEQTCQQRPLFPNSAHQFPQDWSCLWREHPCVPMKALPPYLQRGAGGKVSWLRRSLSVSALNLPWPLQGMNQRRGSFYNTCWAFMDPWQSPLGNAVPGGCSGPPCRAWQDSRCCPAEAGT